MTRSEEQARLEGFEIFDPLTSRRPESSTVTIQKKGVLTLNDAAYGFLGQPKTVQLLFNREKRQIGIRAVSPDHPSAHNVRPQPGRSYLVSAVAFLKFYDILPIATKRYTAKQGGTMNMVWIDLNDEGHVIERSGRSPQNQP